MKSFLSICCAGWLLFLACIRHGGSSVFFFSRRRFVFLIPDDYKKLTEKEDDGLATIYQKYYQKCKIFSKKKI